MPIPEKTRNKNTIVSELKTMHQEAKTFARPLYDRALANYRRFRVLEDFAEQSKHGHKYTGRSRVVDAEPNRVVESIAPRITKGASVEYSGRNPDGIKNAPILNKVTEYELDIMRFEFNSRLWVKEALITGLAWGELIWRRDELARRKRVDLDRTEKDEEPLYDLPWFSPVDFFKLSWSPHARNYDELITSGYTFKEFEATKGELLANANYDPVKVKKLMPAAPNSGHDDYSRRKLSDMGLTLQDGQERMIRGFEFQGNFDLDGDGHYENCLIVVAGLDADEGRPMIIRLEVDVFDHGMNTNIPYRPIPVPHEMCGMSPLDAPAGMFAALTALLRQSLDAGTMALNPIIKAAKLGGVDLKRLVSRPGAIWTMNDLQAVDVVKMPDPSAWSHQMMTTLRSNIQNTTGATDFISGGSTVSSRTTATEFTGKVEQANAKFQSMLDVFEQESLQIFGDQLRSINQQFFDEERIIEITGEDGAKIPVRVGVQDILGEMSTATKTSASKVGDQRVRAQQTIQLWSMFGQDPYVDPIWIRRMVLKDVFDKPDADEHIKDPARAQEEARMKEMERIKMENSDPLNARIQPTDEDADHIKGHDLVLTNPQVRGQLFQEKGAMALAALEFHREEHVQQFWLKQGVTQPPTRHITEEGGQEQDMDEDAQDRANRGGKNKGNELPAGTPGRPPNKTEVPGRGDITVESMLGV